MLFCMIMWVACIVFMSVLRKREAAAHMLSAEENWELAPLSHRPEQVHLPPWGWCTAQLPQQLFHKRKLLPCYCCYLCSESQPRQTPPSALTTKSSLGRDGSKSGTSPSAGVPECWPPASIKLKFECVFFCPPTQSLHLGRWTQRQVFA